MSENLTALLLQSAARQAGRDCRQRGAGRHRGRGEPLSGSQPAGDEPRINPGRQRRCRDRDLGLKLGQTQASSAIPSATAGISMSFNVTPALSACLNLPANSVAPQGHPHGEQRQRTCNTGKRGDHAIDRSCGISSPDTRVSEPRGNADDQRIGE
jgi:hypothetical protein